MTFPTSLLLGAAALLPMHPLAQPSTGAGPSVELRANALVDHARIALADVALIHASKDQAAKLGSVELGRAPRIGYVERLSRSQVEQAIRRTIGDAGPLEWRGAAAVAVRTKSQNVAAPALAQAAIMALQPQVGVTGAQVNLTLAARLNDVEVPLGQLELRPRAQPIMVRGGRAPVWIDLVVDGEVYRSVMVQLAVAAHRPAYVAKHAIEAGAHAGADDFAVADADLADADALSTDQPLAPFRAARTIRTGQALSPGAMLASDKVMRGDQVRLVVHAGQIGIETAAIAMADAGPGQLVRVRPSGSQDIVTGRLSPSGTVTID
jgi:flagella basal body P-ring formation protein FlgA